MFGPALKCEHNAIYKQNYSLKLFITFKWPILAVSALEKIYIFLISSKKSFITLNTVFDIIKLFLDEIFKI